MSETSENQVTAALTFKVPQRVGWSVQSEDQSWTGNELVDLVDCLTHGGNRPMTVSLSVIFELNRNDGAAKPLSD